MRLLLAKTLLTQHRTDRKSWPDAMPIITIPENSKSTLLYHNKPIGASPRRDEDGMVLF